MGLKLHIVNEKLEELQEHPAFLSPIAKHFLLLIGVWKHSNVCDRRYGSKMDAENRFLSVLMATF